MAQGKTVSARYRTRTSTFGSSRRESHDASPFYSRFDSPKLSQSSFAPPPILEVDHIWCGDARNMDACIEKGNSGKRLPDESVALVVTSPPYFAGKEYELASSKNDIPGTYDEYLQLLKAVFAQCCKKLEPGGRIAVNAANLGRKPYRSLSSDIISILEELGFLLRAEIIWVKSEGQSGSCAWGSFQSPANPVIRDMSERIIVASKGSFSRALSARQREELHLPCTVTMSQDEFMEYTNDIWKFQPDRASRVGHPAPFPIELPRRLIALYTYEQDLVLDPFMGSGTTAIAALQSRRRFAGFELDDQYIALAEKRIQDARSQIEQDSRDNPKAGPSAPEGSETDAGPGLHGNLAEIEDLQARASKQGLAAKKMAKDLLALCGFEILQENARLGRLGIEVSFKARARNGILYFFDISGAFSGYRPGLMRTDTLWKALGKASVLHALPQTDNHRLPYILLTTNRPKRGSSGARALQQVWGEGKPIRHVFEMADENDCRQLYRLGNNPDIPEG